MVEKWKKWSWRKLTSENRLGSIEDYYPGSSRLTPDKIIFPLRNKE